jgi:hypothetical protein
MMKPLVLLLATEVSSLVVPPFKLASGDLMPAIGYGTWLSEPGEVGLGTKAALESGYRLIDEAVRAIRCQLTPLHSPLRVAHDPKLSYRPLRRACADPCSNSGCT